MPKLKPGTVVPTPEEDAAITAAAMQDPDAIPYTDSEWAEAKPVRGRGRPSQAVTKVPTSIRLSPSVLDAFRRSGSGWQTRVNQALFEYANSNALFTRYGDMHFPEFHVSSSGGLLHEVDRHARANSERTSMVNGLCNYLILQLGEGWLKGQAALSWEKKHPIGQWETILERRQASKNDLSRTGAFAAWVYLGYHLYLIRECSQMKTRLIKRLKEPAQFEAARFEIAVGAALLTSGFDVKFVGESGTRHPDIVATSRLTGQSFAIEVKQKHRRSIDEVTSRHFEAPNHVGIDSLLFGAIEKDTELPLIVFIDVNLPVAMPGTESYLLKELQQSWAALDKSPWQNKDYPCVGAFFYNDRTRWMLDKEIPANSDYFWMICMPSLHQEKLDAIPYLRKISEGFAEASSIPQGAS